MQKKLAIQDTVRLAGVSKAAAFRALNGNLSVNGERQACVMRAVQEYNFVPSSTAVGLAGGYTCLIGVLAPPLVWPALPEIIRCVAEYIEENAYEIALYGINFANFKCDHSEMPRRIVNLCLVSASLAAFTGELLSQLARLYQDSLPIALINDQEVLAHLPRVWVSITGRVPAPFLSPTTRWLMACWNTLDVSRSSCCRVFRL